MLKHATLLLTIALPWAAAASTFDLPRKNENVTINAVLDERSWREALRIVLSYENDPGENTAAPVGTVAWLWEDGESLYVAFEASDPDPTRIRAWLRDRDSFDGDDFVGISLDTYNDSRRAFEFFVNPLGVQLDRTHDDVNKRSDGAWNAIWESAGKIIDDGYVVEMRIPLDQLRFQDTDSAQTWGFRLIRQYPRGQDISMSNIAQVRGRNCTLCQYPELVGFDGSRPSNNTEIVPTLTMVMSGSSDEPGEVPLRRDGPNSEAGVTIRHGLTPEISANLAINPDFSQVEADRVQLDINNRFALSYPERRPFFLDGADYFVTPFQAVFTRTVASPDVAGKVTGKRKLNTIGMFAARDEVTSLLFPGPTGSERTILQRPNDVFVGRYARTINETSSLGGLLTVRDGDSYKNRVGGFDGRWRFNDHHEFTAQLLYSETEYPLDVVADFDQPSGTFRGEAFLLQHAFETRDWFTDFKFWSIDDNFRADAGLINQAGSARQEYSLGHKWYSDDSWWNRLRLRGAYEIKDRDDGQLLEETYIIQFTFNGALQSSLDINMRTGREYDQGRVFDYDRVNVSTSIKPIGGLSLRFNTKFGDEIDIANARLADQRRYNANLKWNLNKHMLLRLNGTRVELQAKTGERIFDADVIDARLTWQFNLRSYLRVTFQQTDISRNAEEFAEDVDASVRNVGRQLVYSWKMNPQTVFYLGYTDAYVDDDDLDSLVAAERSWFMKIGYAWSL